MKTYLISQICHKIDWSTIPALEINQPYLNSPQDIHAYAQICYDSAALYLHFWKQEANVRAVETGSLGMPCKDSCLEFFFSPCSGDPRYFNFEFNPNGCLYLGIGQSIHDLTRLIPDDASELFKPVIHRLENGWEIFFQIPHEFIRRFFPHFSVESGKNIRANCYTCADMADPPHYYSWNPVDIEPLTFHYPNHFGLMKFE